MAESQEKKQAAAFITSKDTLDVTMGTSAGRLADRNENDGQPVKTHERAGAPMKQKQSACIVAQFEPQQRAYSPQQLDLSSSTSLAAGLASEY